MRAQLHAFFYCASHQHRCVGIQEQYAQASGSTYNESQKTDEWKLEAALALSHTLPDKGVGVETTAEWQPEATALVHYGLVASLPPLDRNENTGLVSSLYNGRALIWP
jgi:hypothetical protein